jgi:outer membrane immunogenic protein
MSVITTSSTKAEAPWGGGLVVGLEGTVDGTSLSNTGGAASDVFFVTAHSRSDIQGSIRGRVGIALGGIFPGWDRALIYATGGAAFGGFNTDITAKAQIQ